MERLKPFSARWDERHAVSVPFTRFNYVTTEFTAANLDTVVEHDLPTSDPEAVRFEVVSMDAPLTHSPGVWKDVAYAAGNFTADASTWGVDAGDVQANRYCLIGNTMFWTLYAVNTDVGAGNQYLRAAIPDGYVANGPSVQRVAYATDNGVYKEAWVNTAAGVSYISIYLAGPNWTQTALDNTSVYLTIPFEVQRPAQSGNFAPIVYRDGAADRRAWGPNYIILRSTVPGTVRLRLSLEPDHA